MSFISDDDTTKALVAVIENTCKAGLVPLLWGPPGIGKTALVRALAKKHGLNLHILIPSTMDPADVNGLPALKTIMIPADGGEEVEATVTENTLQYWAQDLLLNGKGMLFIDEASTATPAVQASLLSVLQGRLVSGRRLSDDIWMIAAANDASDAADGWELAPPLANRFAHLEVRFNLEAWLNGMLACWGEEYETEAEHARQVYERSRIVAFVKSPLGAGLANAMPSTAVEAGKAWPSPRSWDNLANALALVDPEGPERRFAASVRHMMVEAFIGQRAANTFITFSDSLSLPSLDSVMANPAAIRWDDLDSSEVFIIVQSLIPMINAENHEKILAAFEHIVKNHDKHKDVVIGQAFNLIDAMKGIKGGTAIIAKSLKDFVPALQAAGIY